MKGIAVIGDALTHGATIITGSSTRFIDGKGVARIGDLVSCPEEGHGVNAIVGSPEGVFLEGQGVAMEGMFSECGAEILPTGRPVFRGTSSGGGSVIVLDDDEVEVVGIETEAMNDEERSSYVSEVYGSASASSIITQVTTPARSDPGPTDTTASPPPESVTVGCEGITNATPDSYRLSSSFVVADFTTRQLARSHPLPNTTRRGQSRATVICNLKHLAQNTIEPFKNWVSQNFGYTIKIGSGFRNATGGSDHNIGSAADIYVYGRDGNRVSREQLRIVAVRFLNSGIPYTQFILEYTSGRPGWLHIANKKSGVMSSPPVMYTFSGGRPYNSTGRMPSRA